MSKMCWFSDPDELGTVYVTGPDGRRIKCDILFTFTGQTGKDYIVYTDNTLDEAGNVQVYANTYEPGVPNNPMEEIETEEEWDVIRLMLSRMQELIREAAADGEPLDEEALTRQIWEEFGDDEDDEEDEDDGE